MSTVLHGRGVALESSSYPLVKDFKTLPFFFAPSSWLRISILVAPLRFFQITSFGGFTLSLFRASMLLVLILYLLEVLMSGRLYITSLEKRIVFFITLILALTIIPILYSPNLFLGDSMNRLLIKLTGWLWVLTVVLLVALQNGGIVRYARTYVLSSILPMAFGWYEVIGYYLFGITKHMSSAIIQSPNSFGVRYNIYFRPSGTFLEPNYYPKFRIADSPKWDVLPVRLI